LSREGQTFETFRHPEQIETAAEFLARVAWIAEPEYRSKFGALYLDELDDGGALEHDWLIDGWLSTGDKSVMAGASRSGKSFLAIHTSMCVAYGRDFMGLRTKRGGVVYQAGEGARGVKKRLRAWRMHHNVEYSRDTPFVLLQKAIDIYRDNEKVAELIDEINAHAALFNAPLRLVVIDTLATASVGADEISGKDMSIVLDNVQLISQRTGAHVLLVHHMNAGGQKVRGHTSIYANVDQVVLVVRDEATKIRTVTLDKAKDEEEGSRFQFEMPQIVLGIDENGGQVTSCICQPIEQKEAVRREEERKGLRLAPPAELFMKAFFAAEQRYGYAVPGSLTTPARVRAIVPWEDVKRMYTEMSPSDVLTPDQQTTEQAESAAKAHRAALKTRIQRHREELMARGILGIASDEKKSVVYHTGVPLRAFPQTQIVERESADPALDIPF
jgi:RecA-family ATPase